MDVRIFLILALLIYLYLAIFAYFLISAVAGFVSYCWRVYRDTDWRRARERMQANAAIKRFNRGKATGYPSLDSHLVRPGMRFNAKRNRIEITARRQHSFLREIRW